MAYNYISVSGVGSAEERAAVSDIFNRVETGRPISLFVGVQSSTKSQILGIENRMGRNWHPVGDDIVPVLQPIHGQRGRNVLHFSSSEKAPEAAHHQVSSILARMKILGVEVEGMQLNGLHVGMEDYSSVYELIRPLPVRILQLSREVIKHVQPSQVADQIAEQPGMHVLLDTSGGTGEPYNPDEYKPWVETLSHVIPHHIGVAGGLKASNIREKLEPLLTINQKLSVDAEGNLRSGGPQPQQTWLNLAKVHEYVAAAYELLA